MATWRGKATALVRVLARRSWGLTLKTSATRRWMSSMARRRSSVPQMLARTSWARSRDSSRPERVQKARIRTSEPSSSRMFDLTLVAMKYATSSGSGRRSSSAFFLRMATRVSKSGGWMSAMSPHSNRERSRSSISGISLGERSLDSTICRRDS